ncbi:hypothetical protein GCM10017567_33000 [Amycolatopsis bullii]|uniref:Uncharacterized protein n=1 Tax=Amycolatopsis bullii TaxID=941987 RepID=A0ABQ3KDM1_9PSEU|nr:hypothetical protein GCM10017567_33000 [Amycolatopsis bullii]
MSAPSFAESTLNLGSRVGRYFGLVSMLPALFLVLWSAALAASGAWYGPPHPEWIGPRIGGWSLTGVAWILLASLATGLFLHPLQFAMTQVLEGYWGYSRAARVVLGARIRHHRARALRANDVATRLEARLEAGIEETVADIRRVDPAFLAGQTDEQCRAVVLRSAHGNHLGGLLAAADAAAHATERYPDIDRIMPTRLGNALRREEDRAGKQYGLDAVLTAPHFTLVAPDKHVQYLRDTRQQMDTSVRLCVVSLLGCLEAVACLLTDGWWLLASLAPYTLAYLAYRAAVAAADEYTTAVKTVIDLNRFALYEGLNAERPHDTREERRTNAKLMDLLDGEQVHLRYRKPPAAGDSPPTPPKTP